MVSRVFLSYASSNTGWVQNFCDADWFLANIGTVELVNYKEMANVGSVKDWISDEVGASGALIAFISSDYIVSKYSNEEWRIAIDFHKKKKLVLVPVVMDAKAKEWWAERKHEFGLAESSDSYAYLDLSDGSHPQDIISKSGGRPVDSVIRLIGEVAKLIKLKLIKLHETVEPAPAIPDQTPIVVLGHVSSSSAPEITQASASLVEALAANGKMPRQWPDAWGRSALTPAQVELLNRRPLFIQPAAPVDFRAWSVSGFLNDTLKDVLPTDTPQTSSELAGSAKFAVWCPSEIRSDLLKARIAAQTDESNPLLFYGDNGQLVLLVCRKYGVDIRPVVPVVVIEDLQAGTLREALYDGVLNVVSKVVQPAPEPWPFYNSASLESQLKQIKEGRAIVVLQDLGKAPAADMSAARTVVESKVAELMARVKAVGERSGRAFDLFWTVLVVRNRDNLPFVAYPGRQFPNMKLLPFLNTDKPELPVAPDPDAALLYQEYLRYWAFNNAVSE